MKKQFFSTSLALLLLIFATGMTSCDFFGDDTIESSELVGNWTIDDATAEVFVGETNITNYLQFTLGYTQAEAQDMVDSIVGDAISDIQGTIELNKDKTYTLNMSGEDSESGEWSFNSDKNILTLSVIGGMTVTEIFVSKVNGDTMVIELGEEKMDADLDQNGTNESEVTVQIEAVLKKV